jgi:hypothetical protein
VTKTEVGYYADNEDAYAMQKSLREPKSAKKEEKATTAAAGKRGATRAAGKGGKGHTAGAAAATAALQVRFTHTLTIHHAPLCFG